MRGEFRVVSMYRTKMWLRVFVAFWVASLGAACLSVCLAADAPGNETPATSDADHPKVSPDDEVAATDAGEEGEDKAVAPPAEEKPELQPQAEDPEPDPSTDGSETEPSEEEAAATPGGDEPKAGSDTQPPDARPPDEELEGEPPPRTPRPGAPPDDQHPSNEFRIQADHVRVQDRATAAEGNVRVEGSDLSVTADSALIDADQIWLRFVGNVTIGTKDMRTTATRLDINLETREWRATDGRTVVQPTFFAEGVEEPVYLRAKTIYTPPDRNVIKAIGAHATTCSKDHPHYELRSRHVRVIPDNKVVFRKPELRFFGHRVFRYPFNLVLSIDGNDNFLFPEIGENSVEGKYAKFAYYYVLDENNSGLARLHFTEKRGTGYGFDHALSASQQDLGLTVFYEPSESALTSRLVHNWTMSDELNWSLNSSYQQNSGYYGTSENLNSDWSLRRTVPDASSQLGLQQSTTTSGNNRSQRLASSFSHQQQNGTNSNWGVRATMRDSKYLAGQPADEELEAAFDYSNRQKRFDWKLVADNRFDLDGSRYTGDSTYRALNRLPEITFNTDTDRLDGWRPFGRISTRGSLELGRFEQDPDDLTVNRAALKFDFGGSERRLTGNSRLGTSARYYQSIYDEGSAQYLLALNSQLRQEFGSHWTTRLQGNYSRPHGFSPIRLDYWGKQTDLYYQAVRLSPNHSRIDLSVGYDFVNDSWRTALGQFEFMTSRSSKLRVQTGYEIERSRWRPIHAAWTFAHPGELYLTLDAQYDIETSKLWQSSFDIDWKIKPKTRIEFLGRYSGFTHKLDQMDIRLTRDLHCWIGSISYSKPRDEWQINLGIKAFPAVQTNFGASSGARFESGAGGYY